jgi:predicted enzyme related to lactoylglutathione lyase
MAGITLLGISFDAHDPAVLAAFWAAVLHRDTDDGASADFASIPPGTDPGSGPLLMFHRVPEGKAVKNRVHLDLRTADVGGETARLLALGANELRPLAANDGRWVSLADPEGNEFDLVAS